MYISEEDSDSASIAESLKQRLSDSLLSWWRVTGEGAAQQTLAELVGVQLNSLGAELSESDSA